MHTDQYRLGYARPMTELEKGPRGLRRGRGARERILSASQQLFRDQGINCTGMDQLCAVAEVSKRTLYQHFPGKDELIAEHLRRFDPDILPEVFDRTDLTPRERLLAAFDIHPPLCPFIAAAVEIHDPGHPARVYARDYKQAFAARLTETAREAGATNPEQLGEQLALLLDGASARSRVLNTSTFSTAAAIAAVLVDNAIPTAAVPRARLTSFRRARRQRAIRPRTRHLASCRAPVGRSERLSSDRRPRHRSSSGQGLGTACVGLEREGAGGGNAVERFLAPSHAGRVPAKGKEVINDRAAEVAGS